MWKKIIIGSVVLFVASSYLFFTNNDALSSADGEIAHLKQQFRDTADKSKEYHIDRYVKAYAELRTEEFSRLKEQYTSERADLEAESATMREEIARTKALVEAVEHELKTIREELAKLLNDAASAVELDSAGDIEMRDVAQKVTEFIQANTELEREIAQEEARIVALGAESERLLKLIADGKKLNQDRQARISPADLSCSVLTSDPQWDYVILDAGVDKGIVIGSRLAVMRGDVQVCELSVTLVESNRTSCDVVYSTLKPGERVRSGDRVIAAPTK